MSEGPWPVEIRVTPGARAIEVDFDDGRSFLLPAEYLRVESPSAEVQGHGPSQKVIVPGKREVTITGVDPVGNYAVRLVFSDGHTTGIYAWPALYRLGVEQDRLWPAYLEALAARGLSR
ncbi:gamma-butyrobetaine hydroxylase-like domain-containing protein [Geminicoccus harenae]|uniref:gamma-butyrobetaine hydroxylase-like domain-containing protein n=1 Tax=Geminicoccus harenae TaxID=2498453 RepID=UPI00168AC783|nr:DUF971 domain-containing protein [Geminicoccus harenae]